MNLSLIVFSARYETTRHELKDSKPEDVKKRIQQLEHHMSLYHKQKKLLRRQEKRSDNNINMKTTIDPSLMCSVQMTVDRFFSSVVCDPQQRCMTTGGNLTAVYKEIRESLNHFDMTICDQSLNCFLNDLIICDNWKHDRKFIQIEAENMRCKLLMVNRHLDRLTESLYSVLIHFEDIRGNWNHEVGSLISEVRNEVCRKRMIVSNGHKELRKDWTQMEHWMNGLKVDKSVASKDDLDLIIIDLKKSLQELKTNLSSKIPNTSGPTARCTTSTT